MVKNEPRQEHELYHSWAAYEDCEYCLEERDLDEVMLKENPYWQEEIWGATFR